MKKALLVVFVLALVAATVPATADYYRTKADYRAGKLTPGNPPGPKAGTDDCAMPTPITGGDPLSFSDTGDTTGATDTVSAVPLACNGNYVTVAGPDHIYTFTVGNNNMLSFSLSTSSTTYDPSIYSVSTCNDGNTCVSGAASDNCFATELAQPAGCPQSNSTEAYDFMYTPGTYFFYVDSFYSAATPTRATGPYTLTVTGQLPVELIEFDVN